MIERAGDVQQTTAGIDHSLAPPPGAGSLRRNTHRREPCMSFIRVAFAGENPGAKAWGRPALEEEGGGRGSGTQKFVYQEWPKSMFPLVNFTPHPP